MTDRQKTFDRIKQSAAYAERASRELPSDAGTYLGAGCFIVFLGLWCLMALAFAIGSHNVGMGGIVPAVMFLVGIAMLLHFFGKIAQYSSAPTQATPAIIISKHSRSRGKYSSDHITLEFEDGQRKEFRVGHANEASLVGVGDAGIAFTKHDVFMVFDRVT